MHLMQALAPDCFGALDFVDADGNPTERKLTIRRAGKDKPPAGGKEKLCIWFAEDPRKCFLASGQAKKVAALLRKYEVDHWVGAVLLMSCGPVKLKGQDTMGMIVKNAAFPKSLTGAANVQP